jgi:hypothetical protein
MSENNQSDRDYYAGKKAAYFVALVICSILVFRTYQYDRKGQPLDRIEYLIGVIAISNCLSVQINIADVGKIIRTVLIKDK